MIVVGALLVLGALILGACSSSDDEETTAAAPTAAPAAAPTVAAAATAVPKATEVPGVQRVVFSTPPPPLSNALRDIGGSNTIQLRPMYDHLIGVDPEDGSLVPGLATEWSIDPSGLAIRFKLREGVQFHGDYGEFTAKDVVHTLADIVSTDSKHSSFKLFVNTRIDVVNDSGYLAD